MKEPGSNTSDQKKAGVNPSYSPKPDGEEIRVSMVDQPAKLVPAVPEADIKSKKMTDKKAEIRPEFTEEAIGKPLFELLEKLSRDKEEIEKVKRAYAFAFKSHDGQVRKSDEPYITHPVAVAISLTHLGADVDTICSGLLHDVIEDCEVKGEEIAGRFGQGVRTIVEGVTKLGKLNFTSKEERQAENFRKLFIAIAEDVRVVLVKLADRLHNMTTLDHMKPSKQAEIASETLEIYAPLANRFGLGRFKWELEDLSLRYLHPEDYDQIERLLDTNRIERESYVSTIVGKLEQELSARSIQADVYGRPKHLFGIWKKMRRQQKTFEELYDVFAIRVIIESNEDKNYCELASDPDTQKCYEVMGLVHALFKPIPGRFKDYIAMPKQNSYQSLHTAIIGPNGRPVEIQIRTRRMHHVAEYGIAAHWLYKESSEGAVADSNLDRKLNWLRQLVEWQQDLKDAREYLDTVKMDLFGDEVFVFSPRGDVFDLPRGATPLDFAYRVHTEIGHHVTGSRVNDRMVPLATPLRNGDICEIITSKNAHPRMDWLNIAQTHSAKSRIRQWFKKHHRDEHIQQGKQMLENELGKANFEEMLRSDKFAAIVKRFNINEPEDILAAIGYGDISVAQIVNRIREQEHQERQLAKKDNLQVGDGSSASKSRNVSSLSGLLHHLAQCCSPVPGEYIAGVVTRGSGITVHRNDCVNLMRVEKDRQMELTWSDSEVGNYPAYLVIECIDRVGIAGDILKKISDNKVNLTDLRVETHPHKKTATVHIVIEVKNILQLQHISRGISQISDVLHVQRQNHRKRNPLRGSKPNVAELTKNKKYQAKSRE